MCRKEKLAKGIRIITVPPLLIISLTILLAMKCSFVFNNTMEIMVTLLMLGIVPVLAYPLQRVFPAFKDKGRQGQRTLAFIFSLAGYLGAWLYGHILETSSTLKLLYDTYLLSVFLLTVVNRIFHLRASGHACSITAPILFAGYFVGRMWALPYLLLAIGSIWASCYLKRHTKRDIAMGIGVCIVSFFLSFQFPKIITMLR